MKQPRGLIYLFILGFFFLSSACALSVKEAQLVEKGHQQYRAWVLSRDYFFGMTRKKDCIKALAWQFVYVGLLPPSYPQKEQLLAFYKDNLSSTEISYASQIAKNLRQRHHLQQPFSEAELSIAYALQEETQESNKKTGVVGRVLPWFGVEKSNMLLRLIEKRKDNNTSHYSAIFLTVTNNGQFYVTGLNPGRYELFINTANIQATKRFSIREGEIRGLSLIDLRKKI
ncbi:hypothetical protein [Legionella fairfieldensis]|uniref:hypothetical protein n=1 Tax=Legionella fairfieldensis TaxID=45064 RepID=UPI00048B263A|nr:hypothetical protein [Legionella fairfieldensis]